MNSAHNLPQFQFLNELGTGGTAQVSKVRTASNKIIALKTILQSDVITNEEFKKLAVREKTILDGVNFPGIVQVFEVQTNEPCYICLEFCSGKTLETYNKIECVQTALNILSAISVNLEFLHLKNIIHADLKPDNIFMPEDISLFATDKLTYLKLSDFSLGKFEYEDDSIRAGLGTVGYMAPEIINENKVSHQSDLFAFGVLAYQILTGQHPFITDDTDPLKINSRVIEEEPTPIQDFRPDINDKLANLINSLLKKEPADRIQSAWEVCNVLRDCGATYQYDKILNPKFVLNFKNSYDSNKILLANYTNRIDTISNKNNKQLHLILSYNFNKNNIYYKNSQFHFKSSPIIPSYLIKKTVKYFMNKSFTEQKSAVEESFINDKNNLECLLLPHILHPRTIKLISKRLAIKYEHSKNYNTATQLFLYAGELQQAENSAYQAAMKYKNENKINEAISILNKVILYGNFLNRKFEIKSLVMVKGDFLKDIGEVDKAEEMYHELIELYKDKNSDEFLAETYKDLGDLYKMKKLPQDGIKYLEKALDIYKELGNELETSKTYNNLGNIYKIINNFKTSLSYFRKALQTQRKLSANEEIASTLNNIGVIYAMTSKFHKAKRLFEISLTINKEIGNKGEIARVLNNLGYCFEVLGNIQKAIEILQESLGYNKEIDSKGEILYNLENLTFIMFSTGQLKESITYLKEGIELATELNDKPHISFFNLYMGIVLVRMGKIKDAYSKFQQVENILENIEDKTILAQLNIEKAQLKIFLNNKLEATNLLEKAHKICDELKDKPLLIKVLLLKLSILHCQSLFDETQAIIDEFKLIKENTTLISLSINNLLSIDNSFNIKEAYNFLSNSVISSNEHIDQCQLLTTLAKYEFQQNDIEQALLFVNNSIALSQKRGLLFDQFNALILYGKILSQKNNLEECYGIYKQALEIAKNLYNQLETNEDKQAFQNKEEFIFLITEIKKLSTLFVQKKEQV